MRVRSCGGPILSGSVPDLVRDTAMPCDYPPSPLKLIPPKYVKPVRRARVSNRINTNYLIGDSHKPILHSNPTSNETINPNRSL